MRHGPRSLLVLLVLAFASTDVWADHNEPAPPQKWMKAELITGFQPCLESEANACVGPIAHPDAVDPVDNCNLLSVAECAMHDECRLACSPAALNDEGCTFQKNGSGYIRARQHAADVEITAKVGGLSAGCEGQTLCIDGTDVVSTHECTFRDATECDPMYCPCTLQAAVIVASGGTGCGVVRKGRLSIKTSINEADEPLYARPIRSGMNSGFEFWDAGLRRSAPPPEIVAGMTFVAGMMTRGKSAPSPTIPLPKSAKRGGGSLVTGYRACEPGDGRGPATSEALGASGCTPPLRNDELCGFGPDGLGEASTKVAGGDIDVRVDVEGIIGCENQVLCLSASQRVVTTRCQDPTMSCACANGCSVVERIDEIVGRGDWGRNGPGMGTGCCKVTGGACTIETKANTLSPNLVRDGDISVGAFFRTGLYRVNAADGEPLDEMDVHGPAFLIGLLVP